MTTLIKFIPAFFLLTTLIGCSEAEDTSQTATPPSPPPEFSKASAPQEFFTDYWEDLSGERYLPAEIQKMYVGRTPLPQTLELIRKHDTIAFIEWYYAGEYIEALRRRDVKELDKMEYQLGIMDVSRANAADVLLLADSAPLIHKTQLLKGEVSRQWEKKDETTWQVTLTRDNWGHRLLVVRQGDTWKLTVPELR